MLDLTIVYSFNNINPFPCSVSGSECKQRTQQDQKIDELDKQIKANGLVPEGFIIIKSQVVEELKDGKHVLEKQVAALTQEVEFLNNYIRTELTSYTQGIAHLKEDIKFMKSQNSKIGSTLPEAQGARTNASVQSWEDSTLPGSKQISVCTNAVLQEKTPKPAEIELEAVRISMEKMRQSFTQEKEQLLVENIKLKRKIHQIRQAPLQMRSLAGEPVQNGRQFPVVPVLNTKGSHQAQPLPQESISAHQRDSLGSIDLVPNGYCSNQIGSLSQPGRREPFTKQHTHGGEMNTKPEVVDKKVCIPQLHLDLVTPKQEEMADIDSLYQSHRLSLEGDHQEDSSDAGHDSRHSSPGSHKHHNFH